MGGQVLLVLHLCLEAVKCPSNMAEVELGV